MKKNTKKAAPVRDLSVKQGFKISRFLVSWEMVLVYILILINLVLMISRTNLYFSQGTIQSIIQSGMDVCPLVLGMIFILMLGDIDVSVASIMIFSSMATGLCCSAGLPAFCRSDCRDCSRCIVRSIQWISDSICRNAGSNCNDSVVYVVPGNCKNHSGCKCIERVSKLLHVCGVDKYSGNSNCTVIVFRNGISICICSS